MLKVSTTGDVTEVTFEIQKLSILISDAVKKELQKLFEKPDAKVLLNMSGVLFIDSSGFAALLSASKTANKNGGQIIFCNISNSALDMFKVLQLHTIFNIINDRSEAVDSFS